jgi:glutamate racemase
MTAQRFSLSVAGERLSGRRPVIVYDSGVGGLTVARHLLALCPARDIVYLADNAWFPYGDKPEGALSARVHYLLESLINETNPSAIVVACNTASTAIVDLLDTAIPIPIFGVLPPIQAALAASATGKIALLATPGTVSRSAVKRLIEKHAARGQVTSLGVLPLVLLAERKLAGEHIRKQQICEVFDASMPAAERAGIDVVILGCTHFPLLKDELRAAFPAARHWIDPALDVVQRVRARLGRDPFVRPGVQPLRSLLLTSAHNGPQLQAVFAERGFGTGAPLRASSPRFIPLTLGA